MSYKKLTIIFVLLILMSPLNSFVSLKIVPSAREQSMGGVGNVSAIGPQGMYFNPSITAGLRSFALAINYQRRFLDTYAQSVFLIRSFKNFNVGFGLNTFNAGKIEVRPPWPTDEVFGEINPADFTFYFNISREIKVQDKTFRLGASPRLYYSKIGEYSASGYGIDLGMFFASIPNFNWGISLLDFGSEIRYYRIRDNLPTRLVGGVEYFLNLSRMKFLSNFKIGADFNYFVYERTSNLNIGGELNINKRLFIRAGYRINNKNEPYSFGLGVVAKKLRFDYAFIPYSLNLGIGHHLSIGLGY